MTNIYLIWENIMSWPKESDLIYVRATRKQIEEREFLGGFRRFNQELYGDGRDYLRTTRIDGKKIMSIREFDDWRKEHKCV